MNTNNLTTKTQEAIQQAQQLAMAADSQSVETGHLMKGILKVDENVTPFLFKKLGVNFNLFVQALDKVVESYPKVEGGDIYLSKEAAQVVAKASNHLKTFGDEYVSIEHMLLSLLDVKSTVSTLMKDNGITAKDLNLAITELRKGSTVNSQSAEETYNALNNTQFI